MDLGPLALDYFAVLLEQTDSWRAPRAPRIRGAGSAGRLRRGFKALRKLDPELHREWMEEPDRFGGEKTAVQARRESVREALWSVPYVPDAPADPEFLKAAFQRTLQYMERLARKHSVPTGGVELRLLHDDYAGLEYEALPEGGFRAKIQKR
ncbi:MAG: hypothetical protein QXO51_02805 [Halobacteria archaeon]